MKYSCILIFCFLCKFAFAQTNEGKNLWFAVPEHRNVGNNTMVLMITSKVNTSGTIRMPLRNWSQTFNVTANAVSLIQLPHFAENVGSEQRLYNGIQIQSNQPVAAFLHQYHNFRSEASVILPTESIGNEYYVMTYEGVLQDNEIWPAEFLIVGTEDNTEIFIELTDVTERGRSSGEVMSINLNTGETYQVQARDARGDFTGTHIVGDKNFALFSGNTWTEVPRFCGLRDNLIEQMYPVATWGRRFVSVPSANTNFDTFRILASKNNTLIRVQDGDTETFSLQAGEFLEYDSGQASYIEATEPIMVAQFNVGFNCSGHFLGDPSMVLLNSVEQTLDTVTLYNSSFQNIQENYINIVLKGDDASNVFFDGQPVDALSAVNSVADGQFSYVRLRVNAGSHTIISEGCGIIATAYGYGEAESYAYSGGARFSPININPIAEGGCLNDTITFDTRLSETKYSFEWDFGNGDRTTEAKPQRIFTELGEYPVELVVTDNCLSLRDTFQRAIRITLRQAVQTLDSVRVCEGEAVELIATDVAEANYFWNGPNGYQSFSQNPNIFNSLTAFSGQYSVVGVVSGCATFPAYTNLDVTPNPAPNPAPNLGEDSIVCTRGDSLSILLNPGNFASYRWQDNSSMPVFDARSEGVYSVEVDDIFGCTGRDSVLFELRCPATFYAPNAFSPNSDGTNDFFQIFEDQILQAKLQIFDRWGNLMFESEDLNTGWDGTFGENNAPEGVYAWSLQYDGYDETGIVKSQRASGSLLLMR